MKISSVTTRVLSTLADSRLVFDRPPTTETHEFVTLELGTDEGLAGVGVTYLGGALTAALKVAVDDLVRSGGITQWFSTAAEMLRAMEMTHWLPRAEAELRAAGASPSAKPVG